MRLVALSLLAAVALVSGGAAYRILVVFPMPSPSHGILGDGVVRSLLKAGHDVTYITPFPKKDQPKRLQQIDASFMFEPMANAQNPFTMKESMSFSLVKEFAYNFSTTLLKNDAIQEFMKDKSQGFDAVITEYFFSELYSGFAQLFQCPWILMSPIGMSSQIEFLIDEVQSPAANPHFMTGYTVPMSLKERIINSFITFAGIFSAIYIDRPHEEPAYLKYYSPAAQARGVALQDFTSACHNIALLLANSHTSLSPGTRLPPNAVEIGGYHIEAETKPLPNDLQELLDNSPEGLIYFSMGSNLKSANMTMEMRRDLLQTFAGLKQKVLWKFETDLEDTPKNVHIRPWVPQQSLLAHKNLKIFITHGGLLSTTEAIHFGVPLIGIPVFGDQPINMERAVQRGYALKVDLRSSQLGKDLREAIQKMLGDPSYTQTVKRLSQLFHDRPTPPARLLSYMTEHVIRTGGAPHLRTAASSVPAYQRYLLDILALIVVVLLLLMILLRALFVCIFRSKPTVHAVSSKSKKKRN